MLNAAKKYHEGNKLQVQLTSTLFERVKEQFLKKKIENVSMIDIGTGDGRVLVDAFIKLSEINFSSVVGTDRRKNIIDFAQETYGSEVMNFEVLDIEHATEEDFERILKNGQFGLGTSFSCLHYAVDHEKTFSNIFKLLQPGGSFYFNFPGTHDHVEVYLKIAEKYPEIKDSVFKDLPPFSRQEDYREKFPEVLQKIGFEIDFLRFDSFSYDLGTAKLFMDQVPSAVPFIYGLKGSLFDQVINYYQEINEELALNTGRRPYNVTYTIVHGLITKKV